MSAIVQLSYNINDKLRLDDHTFPAFEAHHKPEAQTNPVSKSTSFSVKEPCGQWSTTSTSSSNTFVTSTTPSSSTSNVPSDSRFFGAAGSVIGVAYQRFDHQKSLPFHRRDSIRPVALVKTSIKEGNEPFETTVYDLREGTPKIERTISSVSICKTEKFHSKKSSTKPFIKSDNDSDKHTHTALQENDSFPSILGRSCTLYPSKKPTAASSNTVVASSPFSDIPPSKKHCRSVSEPDDLLDSSKHNCQSSWKPSVQSRVWVPIRRQRTTGRAFSAGSFSARGDCSCSIDYGSLRSSGSSTGDSQPTPPASPIPRPASVTVIKQEGGAWTFLSSQHALSHQYQKSSFSPLPSPCVGASPSSSRLQDVSSKSWCHSGLSATKRSLSFSDDFEHRESIEYTPSSTPELERRFGHDSRHGGLLRCMSHPSDLNVKRGGKSRRKARLCHNNRPTLDFAKMKQTSFTKRNRCRDRSLSGSKNPFGCPSHYSTLSNDFALTPTVTPVFPSIFDPDKKNSLKKLHPIPSLSSPCVSFSIGCSQPLSNVQNRIPSTTDEIPTEGDDDAIVEAEADLATASGGVAPAFVRDCNDLDVDDIENEADDEMHTE